MAVHSRAIRPIKRYDIVECFADLPPMNHSRRIPSAGRFRLESSTDFPDLLNILVNLSGREDHVGRLVKSVCSLCGYQCSICFARVHRTIDLMYHA